MISAVSPQTHGQVHMCGGFRSASVNADGLLEETTRLATFAMYSRQPPRGVWLTQLAQAGFCYADKESTTVRCVFCGISVDFDDFTGRNPMQVHRNRSPGCSFVKDRTTSNNMSVEQMAPYVSSKFMQAMFGSGNGSVYAAAAAATAASLSVLSQQPKMEQSPRSRETTQELALPGQPSQPIRSQASELCAVQTPLPAISTQQPGTASSSEPASHQSTPAASSGASTASSPRTEETSGSFASPSQTGQTNSASSSQPRGNSSTSSQAGGSEASPTGTLTYSQLGIYVQEPKRPDFAIVDSRVNTFTDWPHSATHDPHEMAEAGFYYVGQSDLVRCFYCKGGLKSWARSLRPWVEHARFYPQCPFVGQVKSQEFIGAVQDLHQNNGTISEEDVERRLEERSLESRANRSRALGENCAPAHKDTTGVPLQMDSCEDIDDTELNKSADDLENENHEIKNERICKICQTEDVSILFLPCGHLVSCAQCAPALRTCAICRQQVKGRVRVLDDGDFEETSTTCQRMAEQEVLVKQSALP